MKYTLRPYQKEAAKASVDFLLDKGQEGAGLVVLPTGCHAKGTQILMADKTQKAVEDIKENALVMGDDYTPRKVLRLHHGEEAMYTITPLSVSKKPFVVNGGHILHLTPFVGAAIDISVEEYIKKPYEFRNKYYLYTVTWVEPDFKNWDGIWSVPMGRKITLFPFQIAKAGNGEYFGFTLNGNNLYLDGQRFVHHNSGKSLVISEIAHRLNRRVLVFCPSKEILEQNYGKMKAYGGECSMYSASVNQKEISRVTFATIGSVKARTKDFKFKYVIVDECHKTNPEEGMYYDFFKAHDCRIVGLTATPYRLVSETKWDYVSRRMIPVYSKLVTLTSFKDAIFTKVVYNAQVGDMASKGYLSKLNYYNCPPPWWKSVRLKANTLGTEYSDKSLQYVMEKTDFKDYLVGIIRRLLNPKSGTPRKGILVFTKFIDTAYYVCDNVADAAVVTGQTAKRERERIIEEFRAGKIKVVLNVNCLSVGFDYPELDTIVLARPTMSLALYYQIVGRAIRPHKDKPAGWIVDLCCTFDRFGAVEGLYFGQDTSGEWNVYANGRQITNVNLIGQ